MKKLVFIFVFSFLTNLVWEFAHAGLYVHYRGGTITDLILLRASFWDAVMISAVCIPFLFIPFLKKHSGLIFFTGLAIAVYIEWMALTTGRWAYGEAMPIIPLLGMGLSPILQLGVLGYLSFELASLKIKK